MTLLQKLKAKRHYEKACAYIKTNYAEPKPSPKPATETIKDNGIRYSRRDGYDSKAVRSVVDSFYQGSKTNPNTRMLGEFVDRSFVEKMLDIMREKHLNPTDVYYAAGMDRRFFSKIASDMNYKPSKDSCIQLCFAMKLSLKDATELLSRAGYALSHSMKRDVVIEYFFNRKEYNIGVINDVLDRLGLQILGR